MLRDEISHCVRNDKGGAYMLVFDSLILEMASNCVRNCSFVLAFVREFEEGFYDSGVEVGAGKLSDVG